MNKIIYFTIGIIGSAFTAFFGEWSSAVQVLLILMAIDYVSGLVVAGVFKKSPKSKNGGLQSTFCWRGLAKKMMTIIFVGIGYQVDTLLGISYVKDGVCIAFIASELISIIENAGIMGVPIPKVITNAVDLLKEKSGGTENDKYSN